MQEQGSRQKLSLDTSLDCGTSSLLPPVQDFRRNRWYNTVLYTVQCTVYDVDNVWLYMVDNSIML
jgi:hypothetical protein